MKNTFICPYCLIEYTQLEFIDDPRCFDCLVESIHSIMIPRRLFTQQADLITLAENRSKFTQSNRHCPSRKEQIIDRIDRLILQLPLDHKRRST